MTRYTDLPLDETDLVTTGGPGEWFEGDVRDPPDVRELRRDAAGAPTNTMVVHTSFEVVKRTASETDLALRDRATPPPRPADGPALRL
ncbi:MAG TPA: hypothetical protein VG709_06970 [Actinomycetota bacterium]|nr:hypothetical protein [Actinomycetota bacterium]